MEKRDLSSLNPDGGQLTRTFGLTFVRLNPGMNPDGRHIPLGMSAAVRVTSPNYYCGGHSSFTLVSRNSDGKIMSAGTPMVNSSGCPEDHYRDDNARTSLSRSPSSSPCPARVLQSAPGARWRAFSPRGGSQDLSVPGGP